MPSGRTSERISELPEMPPPLEATIPAVKVHASWCAVALAKGWITPKQADSFTQQHRTMLNTIRTEAGLHDVPRREEDDEDDDPEYGCDGDFEWFHEWV